jgi:diguanylate cyclase (GGDEF)-like protein
MVRESLKIFENILIERLLKSKTKSSFLHFTGKAHQMDYFIDIVREELQLEFIRYDLDNDYIFAIPYPPFLQIIEDNKGILDPKDLQVDPLVPQFAPYLAGEPLDESRLPFFEAFALEKKGLQKEILQSLCRISADQPLYIVICNFQSITEESLSILMDLQRNPEFHGHILIQRNQENRMDGHSTFPYVQDYWDKIWIEDTVFELPEDSKWVEGAKPQPEVYLKNLPLMRTFLCFEQGEIVIERIQGSRRHLSPEDSGIVDLSAGVFLNQKEESKNVENRINLEEAAVRLKKVLTYLPKTYYAARASLRLCNIYLELFDYAQAFDWAKRSEDLFKVLHEDTFLAKTLTLKHMACQRMNENSTWNDYNRALQTFRQRGWSKELLFTLVNCAPVNRLHDNQETYREYLQEALDISRRIGHLFYESTALHLLGFLATQKEGEQAGLPFFLKSLEIRKKLGDPLPIIRIQNGLAHTFLNQGKLEDSWDFIRSSLIHLRKIKDFPEICLTLLNLTNTYFYGRDFGAALVVVQKVLRIMQVLNMDNLIFQNIYDVYLLRSYLVYRTGEVQRSKSQFHVVELNIDKLNGNNMPLYWALKGWMAFNDEDIVNMDRYFQDALKWPVQDRGIKNRLKYFLLYEWASATLSLLGFKEARSILNKTQDDDREIANDSVFRAWGKTALESKTDPLGINFDRTAIDVEEFVTLAQQEKTLNGFQESLRDIRFLNHCMELKSPFKELDTWVQNVLELVRIHYPGSYPYLSTWQKGYYDLWQNEESNLEIDLNWLQTNFDGSFDYLGKFPQQLGNGDWGQLLAIGMNISKEKKGCFGLALPKNMYLQEKDKNIIKVLSEHLVSQIKIFDQRRTLERMANTDSLTKAPNRKALIDRLTDELYRWRRYGSIKGKFCLAIMDLDNFKGFNDVYGHLIGDIILQQFVQFVPRLLRDSDFFGRLGGDEFIILLPETSEPEAQMAMKRILEKLAKENSFTDFWKEHVTKDLMDMPSLGCSIGLLDFAKLNQIPDKVDVLIELADHALYEAKKEGKNQVHILNYQGFD